MSGEQTEHWTVQSTELSTDPSTEQSEVQGLQGKHRWQQDGFGYRTCNLVGSPAQGVAVLQICCVDGSRILASRDLLVLGSRVFRSAVAADNIKVAKNNR